MLYSPRNLNTLFNIAIILPGYHQYPAMASDLLVIDHISSIAAALSASAAPPQVNDRLLDTFVLRIKFEPALITLDLDTVMVTSASSAGNSPSAIDSLNPNILKIVQLLFFIINHPQAPSVNDPHSILIELLATVLHQLSLTQITEIFNNLEPQTYSFDSLFQLCLQPDSNPQIQKLAIDIIARSSLVELRKTHQDLVASIFQIFALTATDINVTSAIEKFFGHVVSLTKQDSSIFYKIFTEANVRTLFDMKSSGDSVLITRLVDLAIKLFTEVPNTVIANKMVFDNLYLFANKKDFLQNDDFFYLNKLINLHAVIFDNTLFEHISNSETNFDKQYFITKLNSQISHLFQLYATAVDSYSINELTVFLTNFSYYSPLDFNTFNQKLQHAIISNDLLTRNNPAQLPNHLALLLSKLNPSVLEPYNLTLSNVLLTNHHLPIYAQWTTFETPFHSVKQNLTISKINNLTPTNALVLLRSIATQQFSVSYLVNEIPAILDMYLLNNNDTASNGGGNNNNNNDDALDPIDFATQKNYHLNQLRIEVIDNLIALLSKISNVDVLIRELKAQRAKLASGDVYGTGLEAKAIVESTST